MKPVRKTNKDICKKYGITDNTLQAWIAEGIDVHNDAAMAERTARKHGTAGTEMYQARLRQLKAQAATAEMKAAEMEGRLIDIADCENAMTRIANITKGLLQRLRADLPPALEGQSASRMSQIIGEATDAILTQMSDPEGMAWKK